MAAAVGSSSPNSSTPMSKFDSLSLCFPARWERKLKKFVSHQTSATLTEQQQNEKDTEWESLTKELAEVTRGAPVIVRRVLLAMLARDADDNKQEDKDETIHNLLQQNLSQDETFRRALDVQCQAKGATRKRIESARTWLERLLQSIAGTKQREPAAEFSKVSGSRMLRAMYQVGGRDDARENTVVEELFPAEEAFAVALEQGLDKCRGLYKTLLTLQYFESRQPTEARLTDEKMEQEQDAGESEIRQLAQELRDLSKAQAAKNGMVRLFRAQHRRDLDRFTLRSAASFYVVKAPSSEGGEEEKDECVEDALARLLKSEEEHSEERRSIKAKLAEWSTFPLSQDMPSCMEILADYVGHFVPNRRGFLYLKLLIDLVLFVSRPDKLTGQVYDALLLPPIPDSWFEEAIDQDPISKTKIESLRQRYVTTMCEYRARMDVARADEGAVGVESNTTEKGGEPSTTTTTVLLVASDDDDADQDISKGGGVSFDLQDLKFTRTARRGSRGCYTCTAEGGCKLLHDEQCPLVPPESTTDKSTSETAAAGDAGTLQDKVETQESAPGEEPALAAVETLAVLPSEPPSSATFDGDSKQESAAAMQDQDEPHETRVTEEDNNALPENFGTGADIKTIVISDTTPAVSVEQGEEDRPLEAEDRLLETESTSDESRSDVPFDGKPEVTEEPTRETSSSSLSIQQLSQVIPSEDASSDAARGLDGSSSSEQQPVVVDDPSFAPPSSQTTTRDASVVKEVIEEKKLPAESDNTLLAVVVYEPLESKNKNKDGVTAVPSPLSLAVLSPISESPFRKEEFIFTNNTATGADGKNTEQRQQETSLSTTTSSPDTTETADIRGGLDGNASPGATKGDTNQSTSAVVVGTAEGAVSSSNNDTTDASASRSYCNAVSLEASVNRFSSMFPNLVFLPSATAKSASTPTTPPSAMSPEELRKWFLSLPPKQENHRFSFQTKLAYFARLHAIFEAGGGRSVPPGGATPASKTTGDPMIDYTVPNPTTEADQFEKFIEDFWIRFSPRFPVTAVLVEWLCVVAKLSPATVEFAKSANDTLQRMQDKENGAIRVFEPFPASSFPPTPQGDELYKAQLRTLRYLPADENAAYVPYSSAFSGTSNMAPAAAEKLLQDTVTGCEGQAKANKTVSSLKMRQRVQRLQDVLSKRLQSKREAIGDQVLFDRAMSTVQAGDQSVSPVDLLYFLVSTFPLSEKTLADGDLVPSTPSREGKLSMPPLIGNQLPNRVDSFRKVSAILNSPIVLEGDKQTFNKRLLYQLDVLIGEENPQTAFLGGAKLPEEYLFVWPAADPKFYDRYSRAYDDRVHQWTQQERVSQKKCNDTVARVRRLLKVSRGSS